MTPTELHEGLKALCAEIGGNCCAHIIISNTYEMHISLQPDGILGKVTLRADLKQWDEVFPILRAKWEEHRDLHEANIVRDMAIAIIRITMDRDECRDADLRCDFDRQDVGRYADRAAVLATEMGGKGPFIVIRTDEGNGAEVSE